MKKVLAFVAAVGWILCTASPARSAVNLAGLNRLENITVAEKDGQIDAVFKFTSDYKGQFTPSFYAKSIQIDLPGAYTNPAKREFGLKAGPVSGAMVAQVKSDTVRARVFMNGDPREYSSAWKVKKDGSSVILTLTGKAPSVAAPVKESEPIQKMPEKPVAVSDTPSATVKPVDSFEKDAADLLAKMEKQAETAKADPALSVNNKETSVSEAKPEAPARTFGFLAKPAHAAEVTETGADKTQGKKLIAYDEPKAPEAPSLKMMAAKMIGALALVVSLVFALAWVAQKYMGKINNAFGNANVVKVLTTSSIGVKKQISVVDVAGEIIVLGISGDNITMLTTIDNTESADRLRRMSGGSDKGALPKGIADYMQASSGGAKSDSFLKKMAATLGSKNDKVFSEMPPALLDEDNPLTFAGNLKNAGKEAREPVFSRPSGKVETKDMTPSATKEELLRKVTGAIRAKNGSLGLA